MGKHGLTAEADVVWERLLHEFAALDCLDPLRAGLDRPCLDGEDQSAPWLVASSGRALAMRPATVEEATAARKQSELSLPQGLKNRQILRKYAAQLRMDVEGVAMSPARDLLPTLEAIDAEWMTTCEKCRGGRRIVICGGCDGTGSIECSECGQERDCPQCDGDASWPPRKGEDKKSEDCRECDGSGKVYKGQIEKAGGIMVFDGVVIGPRSARILVEQDAKIAAIKRSVMFRLGSGMIGMVMPQRY
jgi:hypothetical protein